MTIHYQDDQVTVHAGDCLDVLATLADASVDAVVTDPPYGLEFMGKDWDRPWAVSPTQSVGFAGRENNLTLPSFGDNRNANCRGCGGRQRGVKRCECAQPKWDRDPAADMREFQSWCTVWAIECLRVLKPGGHMLAFGGSRTWHRLAAAIEDAGFEIRDSIAWLYGSGFPKSLDVSKAIDKSAGIWRGRAGDVESGNSSMSGGNYERTQKGNPVTAAAAAGWGTALKPAFEPIVVGRKPIRGTVAANVVAHGTGALNIDACRVGTSDSLGGGANKGMTSHTRHEGFARPWMDDDEARDTAAARSRENTARAETLGRWPTNVVIDEHTAAGIDEQSGERPGASSASTGASSWFSERKGESAIASPSYNDSGGASRYFPTFRYEAKAPTLERPSANGTAHPTVKPLDLMRWLVRLVTPPHGLVLDPFAGSGTTAEACVHEHMRCITIEREADYLPIIVARLSKPMAVGFDFEEGA